LKTQRKTKAEDYDYLIKVWWIEQLLNVKQIYN
jgi:hypothetical protein